MTWRLVRVSLPLTLAVLGAACSLSSSSDSPPGVASIPPAPRILLDSPSAQARLDELRARFVPAPAAPSSRLPLVHDARPSPVLATGEVARFEVADAGSLPPDATRLPPDATRVRAVIDDAKKKRVLRSASVELPVRASDAVALEDDTTHVAVRFALDGASPSSTLEIAGGEAIYRAALGGGDVVHRPHAEGTEDFVVFDAPPAEEALHYTIDLSRTAGLRLVSNVLELLDDHGTPRLRVRSPYVVDADGRRTAATIAVNGCAYDTNPRAPWGRPVVTPGASSCGVTVTWQAARYPAIVDPSWVTTGSMTTPRQQHTATLLPSGKTLVAGGCSDLNCENVLATAELFDGTSSFAATGGMTTARASQTAALASSGSSDKVLLVGGEEAVGSAEVFDDATATFTATPAPAYSHLWGHAATSLPSGQVLITGSTGGNAAAAEIYDPATNSFTAITNMTAGREYHTATLLSTGKVLLAGGIGSTSTLASAELFDPVAQTFTATGSMTTPRYYHAAAALLSKEVLIVGGDNNANLVGVSSAEIYDPESATFSATGSMADPRREMLATPLPSGEVLVVGGCADTGITAELFNGTSSFFAAPPQNVPATFYAYGSVVLPSGDVLITGGWGEPDTVLASAQIYAVSGDNGHACSDGSACGSGFCVDGVCCDTACGGGSQSDCLGCSVAAGAATNGTCAVAATGHVCLAAGACDTGAVCDGVSTACPADAFEPATAQCHTAAGACDSDRFCTGSSVSCPPSLLPAGTSCHTAAGARDQSESCTGSSGQCPSGLLPAGTSCHTAAGACDQDESCTGSSAQCPVGLLPAGTVCHAQEGACDQSESCNGVSAACPADQPEAAGTVCAAATECLLAASCTGASDACPAQAPVADGTACTGGACEAGVCVVADAGADGGTGDAGGGPSTDAGTDASGPVALDAGSDARGAVAHDAGTDASGPVALDAGTDANGPAAVDAGTDASGPVALDAGTDASGPVAFDAGGALDASPGSGTDAAVPASSPDAGSATADASADGDSGAEAAVAGEGGCGCEAAGSRTSTFPSWLGALATFAGLSVARRRRRA